MSLAGYNQGTMKSLFIKVGLEHFILGLHIPLFVVLPLASGYTLLEVGVMHTLLAVATIVFEIPSGYLSDRLGRKHVMMLAAFLFASAFALFGYADSLTLFMLAHAVLGMALAFLSGVDEAYLYEVLTKEKEEGSYKKYFGYLSITDEVATIGGLLLSGMLVLLVTPVGVYKIASVLMVCLLVYITFFLAPDSPHRAHVVVSQYMETAPLAIRSFMSFELLLLASGFALLAESGRLLWQPKLLEVGVPVAVIGSYYAGLKLFSILGSYYAGRKHSVVSQKHFVALGVVSLFVFGLLAVGNTVWLVLFALATYFFIENVFRVYQSEYINQRVANAYRNTFLSANSFFTASFSAGAAFLFGYLGEKELLYAFLFLVVLKMLGSFSFLFLKKVSK